MHIAAYLLRDWRKKENNETAPQKRKCKQKTDKRVLMACVGDASPSKQIKKFFPSKWQSLKLPYQPTTETAPALPQSCSLLSTVSKRYFVPNTNRSCLLLSAHKKNIVLMSSFDVTKTV